MPTPQEYAEFFEVLEMVRPNGGTLPKPPVESRRPDLSPEEIQQRFNEFFDDMASRPAPPPRRLRSLLRSAGKAATGGPSRLTERSHLMRPALRRFPTCGLRSFDGGGLPSGRTGRNLTCLPVFSHEREYKKNSETAPVASVRPRGGRTHRTTVDRVARSGPTAGRRHDAQVRRLAKRHRPCRIAPERLQLEPLSSPHAVLFASGVALAAKLFAESSRPHESSRPERPPVRR